MRATSYQYVSSFYQMSIFLLSGIKTCSENRSYVGMRGKVLSEQGKISDDIGVDNLQMKCQDGEIHDAVEGLFFKGHVSTFKK